MSLALEMNSDIGHKRQLLRNEPNCQIVSREEYCRLAISHRQLVRCNEPKARMYGMAEPITGWRFFIEAEKLFIPTS